MVQSGCSFNIEDRLTLADGARCGGMKEYDAGMIKLFSLAHLPKEPLSHRWDAFNGRRSTDRTRLEGRSWKEDGSAVHFENGPDSLLYKANQAQKPDQSFVYGAGEGSTCGSEGNTFFEDFLNIQCPSGACGGDKGGSAWGVEPTPSRKLREQNNTSRTITRVSEEVKSQPFVDEKRALTHTMKERHRRLRISSAIKQIADLLGVHGSKVEVLETAAAWI
ncbi:MAG: hypothetical protein Q9216_003080, partial [Gyalolechia sp. 2 TL-2023]